MVKYHELSVATERNSYVRIGACRVGKIFVPTVGAYLPHSLKIIKNVFSSRVKICNMGIKDDSLRNTIFSMYSVNGESLYGTAHDLLANDYESEIGWGLSYGLINFMITDKYVHVLATARDFIDISSIAGDYTKVVLRKLSTKDFINFAASHRINC